MQDAAGGSDHHLSASIHRVAVVVGFGKIVDGGDGDRDRRRVAVDAPVAGFEGEAGRTVVVGLGRVGVGTRVDIGDRHGAVGAGLIHHTVGQGGAVAVARHQRALLRRVFRRRQRTIRGQGPVVDDSDAGRGRVVAREVRALVCPGHDGRARDAGPAGGCAGAGDVDGKGCVERDAGTCRKRENLLSDPVPR